MKLKIRNLHPSEIEVRVQKSTEKGTAFLLYKNARCDMNVLDETVGPFNWQRKHTRDNANCIISIWDDEKQQWIDKEDTGVETYAEKEKGLASDSFKRAGFNWGVGRELYTAPFVYISSSVVPTTQRGGKYVLKGFPGIRVDKIKTSSDKVIRQLKLVDKNGKVVYSWADPRNAELYSLLKQHGNEKITGISKKHNINSTDITYDQLELLKKELANG